MSFISLCLGQLFYSPVWSSPPGHFTRDSHMPGRSAPQFQHTYTVHTPPSLVGWLAAPPMTTPKGNLKLTSHTQLTHTPLPRDTTNRSPRHTTPPSRTPLPPLIKPILPSFSLLSLSLFPPFATEHAHHITWPLEKTNSVVHSAASIQQHLTIVSASLYRRAATS